MLTWFLATALAAPCPDGLSAQTIDAALFDAESAIGQLQSDRFLTETEDLTLTVACLREPIDASFAAHVHRVVGMRAFIGRQGEDVTGAFSAARAADPTYVWPETILPEGHGLRDQLREAPTLDAVRPLPRPRAGVLRFDGVEGLERPTDRPTVMQVLDADGEVVATGWLHPTDALLPYDARRPVLPPLPTGPRRVRSSLLVAAVTGTVASAGLYGWAAAGPSQGFEKASDLDEILSAQRSTNTLVTLSAVSGSVAVSSLTAALLIGRL